jgi:hypothetical protein
MRFLTSAPDAEERTSSIREGVKERRKMPVAGT